MTVELSSRLAIKGALTTTRDAGDAGVAISEVSSYDIADGTGADQANAIYVDDFSIAASGTLAIDLSGSLVDPNNNTKAFTAVKEILIKADITNTNNLVYGNAATNQFIGPTASATHTVAIKPGARWNVTDGYSAAGWPVANGSTDNILLTNSAGGTAVTGTIVIIGEA
jgi:hypothetical protein